MSEPSATQLVAERYELIERISQADSVAAFSLWRGQTRSDGPFRRPIAIREVASGDPRVVGAFAAASNALMEVPNAQLEQILDIVVEEDRFYVVSEWIDGISLERWLSDFEARGVDTPWRLSVEIAIEILRALAVGHALRTPICHHGLTAKSIRLGSDGFARLLRHGYASAFASGGLGRREMEEAQILHFCPESSKGESRSVAADIFGVGLLLRRMLTSEPRDGVAQEAFAEGLAKKRRDLPQLLVACVERALRAEPQQRYQSALEMIFQLQEVLRKGPTSIGPEAIARSVRESMGPRALAPQGLPEQSTMHVDLHDMQDISAPKADANTAKVDPMDWDPPTLPGKERLEEEVEAKPKGLNPQKTEYLDNKEVDSLTIKGEGESKPPKGLRPVVTEAIDPAEVQQMIEESRRDGN